MKSLTGIPELREMNAQVARLLGWKDVKNHRDEFYIGTNPFGQRLVNIPFYSGNWDLAHCILSHVSTYNDPCTPIELSAKLEIIVAEKQLMAKKNLSGPWATIFIADPEDICQAFVQACEEKS